MLERTAGCLESGSLRRLLPASKKSLKSRRTLHSTFWHHGAGDLELSPLWVALVRAAEPVDQQSEVRQKTSTGPSAVLLDFLYPAGTINFLRQYSGWGMDRQDGRWGRSGIGKLGYRQYTSSAKETSVKEQTTGVEAVEEQESDIQHADVKSLYQIMGLTKSYDYEEAWRQYMLLDGAEQQSLRRPLMQYLSNSDRVVDAERTTELFEMISKGQRDPVTYQHTIRAYLKLRDLSEAMELHRAAFQNFDTPTGTAELLAHFVQNSSWSRAFSLWTEYRERKSQYQTNKYNVFKFVDSLPKLGDHAVELAEYVSRRIRNTSLDSTEDNLGLVKFASGIILRALKSSEAFNPSRFSALLGFLQLWQMDGPALYDEAIQTLTSKNESKLAVRCYRKARQGQGIKLSRPTLHGLLKVFCDHHSVLGMKQVLDDFFRFYSRPTRFAYRLCMKEFASQGDASTVHALFEQYKSRFSPHSQQLFSADEIAPLLHVHAKRGELSQVVSIFNQIEPIYKLQPTLLCWNILINAYGKVHDIDGAYECFEKLLESPNFHPDDYTFGVMLGICASRGDLQRAIEVYLLAEELKVEKSTAMLDALVSAYIQEEDLQQAERICEDAVSMRLRGSRTRMWNYLLVAYALRRDLNNVNRLLQRMSEANISYDEYTYSALMQALCIVKQPDRAYEVLKEVMVEAGVRATSFHYAVVMGGYLANGETHKVFSVQNRMMRRNVKKTTGPSLVALKATIIEDQKLLNEGSDQEVLQRARKMFREIIGSMDPQDLSQGPRKGIGRLPLDIAYASTFYSYVMFVLGQHHEFQEVDKLYEEFKRSLSESRQQSPPIQVLSALMATKLQERDHEGVQECWDLILPEAMEQGRTRPLPLRIMGNAQSTPKNGNETSDGSQPHLVDGSQILTDARDQAQKVLPAHKLDLADSLVIYLRSLSIQQKVDEMTETVKDVLDRGFVLDNHTWNKYVQFLARRFQYRLAFKLCEERLMPGWTGWARIRWQLPERNRLPLTLRRARQWPTHLRPLYYTLLYLARGFLELQAMAAESPASENLLSDLERDCPMTVKAIKTMQRSDDEEERRILRGL
jgi:pentatricopeptide repeat-containing protein PET309